jgi:hypothetical protein
VGWGEYLTERIKKLESHSKNKNIGDLYSSINGFDDRGDLLVDPQKF